MKAKVTQLNFHKDPKFDPDGLIDESASRPYIIQIRKHWWNKWKYIMDNASGCPKLFFGKTEVLCYLIDNHIKLN